MTKDEELDKLMWEEHEKECESAAMALLKERAKKEKKMKSQGGLKSEVTVTITAERYAQLMEDSTKLKYLISRGLSNWEGFKESVEAYNKVREKQ